jgi:dipeptidyl aminopeptidase/acylaminoacyl peptidase
MSIALESPGILATLSFFIAFWIVSTPAGAQGALADYKRADGLRELAHRTVYPGTVEPHWIEGSDRFWYRTDHPDGRREFLLVDPAQPSRQPAFDHAKVAAALSEKLGHKVDPERLPVEQIKFEDQGKNLMLQTFEHSYTLDFSTYQLSDRPTTESTLPAQSPDMEGVRFGRPAGPETSLTFVNRTSEPLKLFWLESADARREYGEVAAGASRVMHTYAGHIWLVSRQNGTDLAVFIGRRTADVAVISSLEPVGKTAPTPDASRAPDGKWKAFVKDHNVFLSEGNGAPVRITWDGSPGDTYEGDPVWSPDSSRFVMIKTVPAEEHKVYEVESSPSDQLQPKLKSFDYLKPGDRMAKSRPVLFEVKNHREIRIDDALYANPYEIGDVRWQPDSKRFTFFYNQRGHQVYRIITVDATTGAASAPIEETAKTFIDWTNKIYFHPIDSTGEAIWMSERDGWNHLYLYDLNTGHVKNQITRGDWVVRAVTRVDDVKRQIWFTAGGIKPGQDPYYLHCCRVNFDGTGLTVLTEGDGTHDVQWSPGNHYLIDTWSRVDEPPITVLRSAEDGHKLLDLEHGDVKALLATGWKMPERFTALGRDGKTEIYGVIFRPTKFDPNHKYPIVEDIYAGPHGAFVPKAFNGANGAQSMAELGFIVVQIDGMGTNFRSRAFHDVCYKNLADAGFPDRILWIRAAAAKYPYMDLTRIGIYGTSAGGQSTLAGLLTHGDFYKVGVADCGCHDNRMDKLWWNEQWMGWPVDDSYAANSNVTMAHQLRGKLFLMVGELDTNVDPASTMQVVNALVKAGKDFDLLVMPGSDHGVAGTPYGRRRLQDYLVSKLLGVDPPNRNAPAPSQTE